MKKKKIMGLISILMYLVLFCSVTVFAEEDIPIYNDIGQHRYVNNMDEYLVQLNEGLIAPFNPTTNILESTIESNGYTTVSPMSWPWTDCSNILGHDWSDWTPWTEFRRDHSCSGGYCYARMERFHYCQRTYCGAKERETDTVFVLCNH